MAKVVIAHAIPGTAPDQIRAAGHEVVIWPDEAPSRAEQLSLLADADAALTMLFTRIDDEMLAACPRLRIAANMAVGYDNFDVAAADRAGVWLTNTPGVLAETTADLAFALLMAVARRVAESDRDTRGGGWTRWSPTSFLGKDVHGATLGIIGLGEIGTAMARRGRGFGMRILYTARTSKPNAEAELGAERAELASLLARSDYVSIHTPLTPETRGFIGARELALMRRDAVLVNTARGTIVDQDALIAALAEGRIAGAGLDVTDPEPLPVSSPLLSFPNVVVTPHIGSASYATRSAMAAMAAGNIVAVLAGREPPNPVNRPPTPRAPA